MARATAGMRLENRTPRERSRTQGPPTTWLPCVLTGKGREAQRAFVAAGVWGRKDGEEEGDGAWGWGFFGG